MRSVRRAFAAAFVAATLLPASAAVAQNVAQGKSAYASSVYSAGYSDPGKAVDGNTQGNYFVSPGIFHSQFPDSDWWYVDLGQSYDISSINFWNRTDCCTNRIIGSTIGVFSATPYQSGSPAAVWSMMITSSTTMQTFSPAATGRYVGIMAAPRGDAYLQIAEVEVFGDPTTTTPEPASLSLLAGGLLALGAAARRRARA